MTRNRTRRVSLDLLRALLTVSLAAFASLAFADLPTAPVSGGAAPATAPALVIESFGAVHGMAVGDDTVGLVATVRNAGTQPSPSGGAFGRMYCLGGLDYREGDTIPMIPALAPGATATYRWSVRPSGSDNALVASFSLLVPGALPVTSVLAIPHIAAEPATDPAAPSPIPVARASKATAVLENTRLRLRIAVAPTGMPVGFLWARAGAGWRRVGTVCPFASVLAAEDSQEPWWEFFRVTQMRASNQRGSASLVLTGAFGLRWSATVTVSLSAGAGATEARVHLAPTRPMQLAAIRLCPLLAGDGGLGASVADTDLQAAVGPNTLAAMRWGTITSGALRPTEPPIAGWTVAPIPDVAGADYHVLGWEARAPNRPIDAPIGSQFTARVRLLALAPTQSAADARHVSFTDPPVRIASLVQASRAASALRRKPALTVRQKRKLRRAAILRKAHHHRAKRRPSSKRARLHPHAKHRRHR